MPYVKLSRCKAKASVRDVEDQQPREVQNIWTSYKSRRHLNKAHAKSGTHAQTMIISAPSNRDPDLWDYLTNKRKVMQAQETCYCKQLISTALNNYYCNPQTPSVSS